MSDYFTIMLLVLGIVNTEFVQAEFCKHTFRNGKFSTEGHCETTPSVDDIFEELKARVEAKQKVNTEAPLPTQSTATTTQNSGTIQVTTTLPELENTTSSKEAVTHLLFGRRHSLNKISLTMRTIYGYTVFPVNVTLLVALDFDPVEKQMYWTGNYNIQRAKFNDTSSQIIISNISIEGDGIAVDWVARNLYWSDKRRSVIEVSKLDGSCRKTLINTDIHFPRAIALDPVNGMMYWSDWGTNAKIESNFLNGENRTEIVNSSIIWPNGIALDTKKRYLYWVDSFLDKVEAVILDQGRRVTLMTFSHHIFGFSYYNDFIYWTDWANRTLDRVWLHDLGTVQTITSGASDFMALKAYGDSIPAGTNACATNNGGCPQNELCLFTPKGVSCK